MPLRRTLLLAAALLLGVVVVIGGTTDLRVGSSNCGSAFVPADDQPSVRTGDLVEDDFVRSSIEVDCGRRITGQRLALVLPLGGCAALWFLARRDADARGRARRRRR